MNFITYLYNGVQLSNNQYNRYDKRHVQDQVFCFAATHTYEGRITSEFFDGAIYKRTLDKSIEILSVDQSTRETHLSFWKSRRWESLILGILTMTQGIGGIGVATAVHEGTLFVASTQIALISAIALTVVGIVGGIFLFIRAKQAQTQYEAWQDPIAKYQEKRQQMGQIGYLAAFDHDLKGTFAHPQEVRQLWQEWAVEFFGQFQEIQGQEENVANQIKNFFLRNPLNPEEFHYALEEGVENESMCILNQKFEEIKQYYLDLSRNTQQAKDNIYQAEQELLEKNENERERCLAPAKLTRDLMFEAALKKRKEQLLAPKQELNKTFQMIEEQFKTNKKEKAKHLSSAKRTYKESQVVVQIKQAYNKEYRRCERMYNLLTSPIQIHFNYQKREIQKWTLKQIKAIEHEGDQRLVQELLCHVQSLVKSYFSNQEYESDSQKTKKQERLYPDLDISEWKNIQEYLPPYNPEWIQQGIQQEDWHTFHQEYINRMDGII